MEWPARQEQTKFQRLQHMDQKQLRCFRLARLRSENLNIPAWARRPRKMQEASWIKMSGAKARQRIGKSTLLELMTSRLRVMVVWARAPSSRLSLMQLVSHRKGHLLRMLRGKPRGIKSLGRADNNTILSRVITHLLHKWTQQAQSPAIIPLRWAPGTKIATRSLASNCRHLAESIIGPSSTIWRLSRPCPRALVRAQKRNSCRLYRKRHLTKNVVSIKSEIIRSACWPWTPIIHLSMSLIMVQKIKPNNNSWWSTVFQLVRIIVTGPSSAIASKRLTKSVISPKLLNTKCTPVTLLWSRFCNIRHFKFSRRSALPRLWTRTEHNSRPSITKLSLPRKICLRWRSRQLGQVSIRLIQSKHPRWWRPTSLKPASRSASRGS